uniref:hypothetical protein n=1 Tax=Anaerococcus mediterraneensis TaxID=1870984 RepID=UPI0012FEC9C4|nr:hypothetical protein [Anaerococcus mediterraneensis]
MKEKKEVKIINNFMETYTRMLIVKAMLDNYKDSGEVGSKELMENLYKILTEPIIHLGLNPDGEYRINDYDALYKIVEKRTIIKEVLIQIFSITNKALMSNNVDMDLCIADIDRNVTYLVERSVL